MSEWISVEDRLPPKSDHKVTKAVLVWSSEGPGVAVIIARGVMQDGVNYPFTIKHWCEEFSGQTLNTEVTHWMPLPSPPKEAE